MGSPASSPARTLTAEQKEAEKARLQELVSCFARRALHGCQCQYITEDGRPINTEYRIDKALHFLTVETAEGDQNTDLVCPIAAIQDSCHPAQSGAVSGGCGRVE